LYASSGLSSAINDDGPDPAHDDNDANCLCDSCDPWVRTLDYQGSFAQPLDLTADTESDDDRRLPALEEANLVANDVDEGNDPDSPGLLEPDSPSFSPSSPVLSRNLEPHIHLPCWHNERCADEESHYGEIVSVLDDRRGLGAYECVLCCLHWRQRHHALAHFLGSVHHRRLAFLRGQPMVYCVVCNTLPEVYELHMRSDEHRDHLAALSRYGYSSDCTTRRVITCIDGRLRALRVLVPRDPEDVVV